MRIEKFRWLAGIIAAYPNRKLVGRVRLQKTINLLQRRGFPTDYSYISYHYGPYSEGVQADINLLEQLGLITERKELSQNNRPYSIYEASEGAIIPEIAPFQSMINHIAAVDAVVLELAATYESFRDNGLSEKGAWEQVRIKKNDKYTIERKKMALQLLQLLDSDSTSAN